MDMTTILEDSHVDSHLLKKEDKRVLALKAAIDEGLASGIVYDFDPKQFLQYLKANRTHG